MTNVADEWIPSKSFSISRDDAFNHLKENYTSPSHPLGFMGIDNIYRFYNGVLSKERIKHFLASTEVYSLIKQEKINPKKIWTPIISFHYLDLGLYSSIFFKQLDYIVKFGNTIIILQFSCHIITNKCLVQADLIEVSTLSNSNLGVKFLLCVLDCFSRFEM